MINAPFNTEQNSSIRSRVLLVQPVIIVNAANPKKYIYSPGNEMPLNILYLSAFLDRYQMDNAILDLRMAQNPWEHLDQRLREYQPQLVGITACTCEIWGAHHVAKQVKQVDDAIVTVVGGIQASAVPEQTLEAFPCFDMVVYGEGEHTLVELVRNIGNGSELKDIKGLVYRKNGSIIRNVARTLDNNIDSFPFPSRHLINNRLYYPNIITYNYHSIPTTGIIASRGCPYYCYHCSKGVWGKDARYRSAKNVFEEIMACVENHGIRDFRFYDDVLTMSDGPLDELCDLIIDNKLKITFNCYSRIDHIKMPLLKKMKKAGCKHIKFGIESSSEKAIKLSNRHTTYEQAQTAVDITRKVGILVKGTFMLGMPGEKLGDYQNTIDMATDLSPDLASFGLFQLFPGSKFYNDITFNGDTELQQSIPEQLSVLPFISKAYRSFYFRPKFITQRLLFLMKNPSFIPSEIKRFLKGFSTLVWFFVRRLTRQA